MSSFSPQNLSDDEKEQSAKAASIVVNRFSFKNFIFYSAAATVIELDFLIAGNSKSVKCDVDSLRVSSFLDDRK